MTIPFFRVSHSDREILRFPVPAPGRIALIEVDFHIASDMKYFGANDIRSLADYAPEALVTPLGPALLLADQKLRCLKSAIVIVSTAGTRDAGPLAAHHRDLLWKAFGLPVFEQLRGRDGRVFARECEVHDGLHLDADSGMAEVSGIVTSVSAEIDERQCDCGLETPRLRRLIASRARAAAA